MKKYRQIIRDLGFSHAEDIKARDLLYSILEKKENYPLNKVLDSIKSIFRNITHVIIFGGGPDSKPFLSILSEFTSPPYFNINTVLIVAIDGATELLAKYNVVPDLIFSDLDGVQYSTMQQEKYKSTIFIVHAHGDNQSKLSEFQSILYTNPVVGTTQTTSKTPVINTGGFTDGDRALYFLENFLLPSQSVFLLGYDFSTMIGKYSKPYLTEDTPASILKKRKLDYGAEITRNFCMRIESKVIFLEHEHTFTLRTDLSTSPNIEFAKFHSRKDIEKKIPPNLLYLKQKS